MKGMSCGAVASMVCALGWFTVAACGDEAASGDAESDGGGLAQEAAGGEDVERAEGGEEGGEHAEEGEHGEGGEHAEGDEHGEGGEHAEEGEESGEYVGRGESWDATRRGMRLTLSYDEGRDAFVGSVENTTQATVCAVRVEVHLADGPELGPTERQDLGPGESAAVELPAEGQSFESWTAHPESSACGQ